MAHFLTPPVIEPTKDIAYLLRLDKERVDNGPLPQGAFDWPGDAERPRYVGAVQMFIRKQHVLPDSLRDTWTPALFAELARERLRCGAPLIGAARVIVTDRLHAVLLGLMMGRVVICLDNFYGKIGRYSAAWFEDMPGLYFADDINHACFLAESLAGGGRS